MNDIIFQSVTKKFSGVKKPIIKNLSLSLKGPGIFCFFGPSGIGKTTLFNLIAGSEQPDVGRVIITGDNRRIGYVFQEDCLLPWKTIFQNLDFIIEKSCPDKVARKNRIDKLLKNMGLKDSADKTPDKLSGGEKQRVNLARALAIDPDILLLDEPFSHLDEITASKLRLEMVNILEHFNKTILINTHNSLESIYLADYIYILEKKPVTMLKKIKIDIPRPRSHFLYNDFIIQPKIRRYIKILMKSIGF